MLEIPKYLYHATYGQLVKKIKSKGLGNTKRTYWEDSKPGVVYLADDPDVAESYAEANEDCPESYLDHIVIFKVDTSKLNKDKLFVDKNVNDDEIHTYEYHEIIPFDDLQWYTNPDEIKTIFESVREKYPKFSNTADAVIQTIYDQFNDHRLDTNMFYLHFSNEDINAIDLSPGSHIIFENRVVFRQEDFKEILATIDNMNDDTFETFDKNYFNLFCKTSKYGSWKKTEKGLAIMKFDFSNYNTFKVLMHDFVDNFPNEKLNKMYFQLKDGKAAYFVFSVRYGLLCINSVKYSHEVISHELIHFFQDVLEVGIVSEQAPKQGNDEIFYPIEWLAKARKLDVFNLIRKETIPVLINEYEIIPYFNNMCYAFSLAKAKDDMAILAIKDLISFVKENEKTLTITKIKEYFYDRVIFRHFDRTLFAVLIICLVYRQHLTLLKKIISNYFKDKK